MLTVIGIAQLALALLFALTGLLKLRNIGEFRQNLIDFSVPRQVAGPLSFGLPIAELLGAALLTVPRTARIGAILISALLVLFLLAIAVSLLRGQRPVCHCFGTAASPIAWATFARNLMLMAVAMAVATFSDQQTIYASFASLLNDPALALLSFVAIPAILFEAWVVYHLFQQQGRLLLRIDALEQLAGMGGNHHEPLPIGSEAPAIAGVDLNGASLGLSSASMPPIDRLVIFLDPLCGHCVHLVPLIEGWIELHAIRFEVVVVSRGDPKTHIEIFGPLAGATVVLQPEREVAQSFGVLGTPGAVFVDPEWRVSSSVAMGYPAIEALVRDRARAADMPSTRVEAIHLQIS